MDLRKTLAVTFGFVFLASIAGAFAQQPGAFSPTSAEGPIYMNGPVYTDDPSLFSTNQGPLWKPYVEQEGSFGDPFTFGSSNLFVPVFQTDQDMFFIDLRGLYGDGGRNVGVFGAGFRRLMDNGLIFGTYGFFDYLKTPLNNEYKAGTLGFELLDEFWDLRLDATFPESDRKEYFCNLDVDNDNLVIRHFEEAAYYGGNLELGVLTARSEDELIEWRNYAGVYAFDHSDTEYKPIYGPRLRTEVRLFDLPWLGSQSRVVFGGQVQYDDVRGTQGAGMLQVRIALGRGPELRGMERRMLNPIRRNNTILARDITYTEGVKIVGAGGGSIIGGFINSDTVDPEGVFAGAGPNSVVLFSGDGVANGGIIQTDTGFFHNEGQTALGAGGDGGPLFVMGLTSGKMFGLGGGGMGVRPTVQGTDPGVDVFTLADGGSIIGIDIIQGRNGVFGDGIEGFTINDVNISGAAQNGLMLTGTNSGDILDSTAFNNTTNGFNIETYDGGVIRGNLAYNNTEDGYHFGTVGGDAIITDNSSQMGGTGNDDDGFDITLLTGNAIVTQNEGSNNNDNGFEIGTIGGNAILSYNEANDNDADTDMDGDGFNIETVGVMGENGLVTGNTATGNYNGFNFTSEITYNALVANNSATGNTADGFLGGDLNEEAIFANNYATDNVNGFNFNSINDSALFVRNLAEMNTNDGIVFGTVAGGSVYENNAVDNMGDGFEFGDVTDGLISYNTAIMNDGNGFNFSGATSGGTIIGNVAGGSMADANGLNGFAFADLDGTTSIINNEASWNTENGFYSSDADALAMVISGNTANNNQNGSGFQFDGNLTLAGGFVSNTANDNAVSGVSVDGNLTGDIYLNETNNNLGGAGFFVGGNVDGNLGMNLAQANANEGILIEGDLSGSVFQNVTGDAMATGNGATGLQIDGMVGGDIVNNLASFNGDDGINIGGGVGGSILDNEAMNNAEDGIDIGDNLTMAQDAVLGSIADNTLISMNGDGTDVETNGENGIEVTGNVLGNIASNILSGNTFGYGMLIDGNVGEMADAMNPDGDGEISSNNFSNNGLDGLNVRGDVFGDIATNTANMNLEDGIDIDGQAFSNILGNTTMMNGDGNMDETEMDGENGFEVGIFNNTMMGTDKVFSENVSNDNLYGSGFVFDTFGGGDGNTIFRHNTAMGNGVGAGGEMLGDGLTLTDLDGGIIGDGNVLSGNGRDGLRIEGTMSGGVIYQNRFDNNGEDGLHIFTMTGGLVGADSTLGPIIGIPLILDDDEFGNLADGNGQHGFYIETIEGGVVSRNTASNNTHDGFHFNLVDMDSGVIRFNNSNDNLSDGYHIEVFDHGLVTNNSADDNGDGSDDGYGFNVEMMTSAGGTAELQLNSATDSYLSGIFIGDTNGDGTGTATGVLDRNTANSNGDGNVVGDGSGILVVADFFGTMFGNTANNNFENGIWVQGNLDDNGFGAVLNGNDTSSNGLNGILVDGDVMGNIVNNNADSNMNGDGILINGNVDGLIASNDADLNSMNGIHVTGNVMGDIDGGNDIITGNMGGDGVLVEGDVTGNITGLRLEGNSDDGLDVDGLVTGNIDGNYAYENGDNGIELNNVVGDITDNQAGSGNVPGETGNPQGGNGTDGIVVNTVDGTISGNTTDGNGQDGLSIDTMLPSTVVQFNNSTENGRYGYFINNFSTGLFDNNDAGIDLNNNNVFNGADDSGNLDDNYHIVSFTGGMFTNNDSFFAGNNVNDADGYEFEFVEGGTITLNEAVGSGQHGFHFSGTVMDPTTQITANVAIFNTDDGFHFADEFGDGANFRMNIARFNEDDGFEFVSATGGFIENNLAEENDDDGFVATLDDSLVDAVFDNNESNDNVGDGYQIIDNRLPAVTGETNTGAGNGANNTFIN